MQMSSLCIIIVREYVLGGGETREGRLDWTTHSILDFKQSFVSSAHFLVFSPFPALSLFFM